MCVCACVRACVRVRACVYVHACACERATLWLLTILVLCLVMGHVFHFGEIAHKMSSLLFFRMRRIGGVINSSSLLVVSNDGMIIKMYIYHALINALSAQMIDINLLI